MTHRIRAAFVAACSTLALATGIAPAAHADVLSLLPGSCGNQPESQPFTRWHDYSNYTPVPGGSFEAGTPSWLLFGNAHVAAGNESYDVAGPGAYSLALPANSSAISRFSCTSIYHPTLRFFVRNTGSPSSHLIVQAMYPGLLGGIETSPLGVISGSSGWQPSPAMPLLVNDLLATLSLDQTAIGFRFVPADGSGAWSIDDVYLDPYGRS